LTAREFAEWIAYRSLEPFGDDWDQAAMIGFAVNRTMGGRAMIEDFRPERETTEEDKAERFRERLRGGLGG